MSALQPILSAQWITGVVIEGDKRGRSLGFPTANLKLTIPNQLPNPGIYAVRVRIDSEPTVWPGVMHVGPRPTFDQPDTVVEIHLLNYPDHSLYGRELLFQCVRYLRPVQKFSDIASLIRAIQNDSQAALRVLHTDQSTA